MENEDEANHVVTSADVFSTAIVVLLAFNFASNTLFKGGSYELVWSLLESLQVIQLIKLFNSRTPGNVGAFMAKLEGIARGQIMPQFIEGMFYVPESDPFSLNFRNAGYTSSLFVLNAQDYLFNISVQVCLSLILLIIVIAAMQFPKLIKLRDTIEAFIFSNGSIRLLMLAYLNLVTFSLLTISEVGWDTAELQVTRLSLILAYVFFVLTALIPIIFFVHFCRHRARWNTDPDFKSRYGTFLAGYKHGKEDQVS